MFDDYTITQLVELRNICADLAERSEATQETADALLIMEYIDEELSYREQQKIA